MSSISLVGKDPKIQKSVLLSTSMACRTHDAPAPIDLRMSNRGIDSTFFNQHALPVAVLLEGSFHSAFRNRLIPEGIKASGPNLVASKPTKMIIVSDADIIRNDVKNENGTSIPLPLGYDRYLNQNFANKTFLLNAINYLCDDEGWMQLRARNMELRLLSPKECIQNRTYWQVINLVLPLLIITVMALIYLLFKRK